MFVGEGVCGAFAAGFGEGVEDGGGEAEVGGGGDFEVHESGFDDGAGVAQSFDELGVVGDGGAEVEAGAVGVGAEDEFAAEDLGGLREVEVFAVYGFGGEMGVVGAFDGVGDGCGEERCAMVAGGCENGVDLSGGEAGAGGVVDGDEVAGIGDEFEGARDGVGAFGAAFDDLDIEEGDAGLVAAFEELAVFGGDDDEDVADVFAIDEGFGGAEPDCAAVELGVDLFLFGVTKARGAAGGREDDGEFAFGGIHGEVLGTWGRRLWCVPIVNC